MSKKSFKDLSNPAMQFIAQPTQDTQEVQDAQKVQKTQGTQQVQRTQGVPHTQGKKGQKLPRINMAFQESNLEYLQVMSRIEGVSITKYVNNLVEKDKEQRADLYEQAKGLLKL